MNFKEEGGLVGNGLRLFEYSSAAEAIGVFEALDEQAKLEMAEVYREAFGGYPWYEVYACKNCGNFSRETTPCSSCQSSDFGEAYPTDWLIDEYFPHMVTEYIPGVLILSKDGNGKTQGFSCGGGIKLGDLAAAKFKGNEQVLKSILTTTGVGVEETVFYENETCVSPTIQQKGIGGSLNFERVKAASEMGFRYICGRTINRPWLEIKRKNFEQLGYDCVAFYPDGDTYEVDGQRRFFFLATKR